MTVDRVGHRGQRQVPRRGRPGSRDPRGRARGDGARLPPRARVQPPLDQDARRLSLGHHQFFEKEERFSGFQSACSAISDPVARRDGCRVRVLRRELERRRRRPPVGDVGRAASWSAPPACRPFRSTSRARRSPDENEEQTRERVHQALRGHRRPAPEPHGGGSDDDPAAQCSRPAEARCTPRSSSARRS